MVTLRAYILTLPYRSIYRSLFNTLYCAFCDISPSNYQTKHSIEEFCRITRRVDPINNLYQNSEYWLRYVAKGAIHPPNFRKWYKTVQPPPSLLTRPSIPRSNMKMRDNSRRGKNTGGEEYTRVQPPPPKKSYSLPSFFVGNDKNLHT